jgi:hypothetical protein
MFNTLPAIGSFIKDLSPQHRSMGVVIDVNQKTNMMLVNFPKKSQSKWIPWNNLGHYIVIS